MKALSFLPRWLAGWLLNFIVTRVGGRRKIEKPFWAKWFHPCLQYNCGLDSHFRFFRFFLSFYYVYLWGNNKLRWKPLALISRDLTRRVGSHHIIYSITANQFRTCESVSFWSRGNFWDGTISLWRKRNGEEERHIIIMICAATTIWKWPAEPVGAKRHSRPFGVSLLGPLQRAEPILAAIYIVNICFYGPISIINVMLWTNLPFLYYTHL